MLLIVPSNVIRHGLDLRIFVPPSQRAPFSGEVGRLYCIERADDGRGEIWSAVSRRVKVRMNSSDRSTNGFRIAIVQSLEDGLDTLVERCVGIKFRSIR
jgi:hypothetical protein